MKKLTFIETLSPREYRALRRWYHVSLGAAGALLIGITVAQLHQLYRFARAQRAAARYALTATQPSQQHDTLANTKKSLEAQLAQLKDTASTAMLHTPLQACRAACGTTVRLNSYRQQHDTVICSIVCSQTGHALAMVRTLQQHPLFARAKITQLHTMQDSKGKFVQATIAAQLNPSTPV